MKFIFLALSLLSVSAFGSSFSEIETLRVNGADMLRHHVEESRYISRIKTFAFEAEETSVAKLGDFVILWGVGSSSKDENITKKEYEGFWRVIGYLNHKGFRVIMNVSSTAKDLAEAFASKTTSVVVYSSHGNESYFYDYAGEPIPTDIFKYRAKNVYQFILSACYGSESLRANYVVPEDLNVYSWSGLTTPDDLIGFLVSDSWTGLEGKPSK